MSTENSVIPAVQPPANIAINGNELQVTARNSDEMASAQTALIAWCENKIALMQAEAKELGDAYRIAVERKWKSATLKRHAQLAEKRATFYIKVKAALEAGFVIVPNFPVSLFAIRTDRTNPQSKQHYGTYRNCDDWFATKTPGLPVGEGDHVNPDPVIMQKAAPSEANKNQRYFWAERFDDIEFPVSMTKPQIMEATSRAMALKIFDEFGILPAAHRYKTP